MVGVKALPRVIAVLLALLCALVVMPGGVAQAHDELIGSDPEDEAVLDEVPSEVVLTFSAAIADIGAFVEVNDADGQNYAEDEPRIDGVELEQDLADLDAGDYTILWRVTSADGHPISGELTFTVTSEAVADDDPTGSDDPTTESETATDDATGSATDDVTSEATTAVESSPAATTDATREPTSVSDGVDAEGAGMPAWVWAVTGLAVLGLVGLLARTWVRGRR